MRSLDRRFWPVGVALAVRIGVWILVSPSRFASDEESYFRAGTTLLATGQQDLFWPPVTGWLIALNAWLLQSTDIRWIRLAWIAMDLGNVVALGVLAKRVGGAVFGDEHPRAARLSTLTMLAYALYLPAISFAQFATSETPALLLVLLALVLLTVPRPSLLRVSAAGLLAGVLAITRPSVLPLLVMLPAALWFVDRVGFPFTRAVAFAVSGALIVGLLIVRNMSTAGEATIAQNSAYNLYLGNRDLYAEDLDLFHPVATQGQIEFRRQYWSGELPYPEQTPGQLQREALDWIAAHPGAFSRRAVGRLARVFAPKTDVLELAGGERAAGIFSPVSLALLGIANVQWTLVLFAGLVGLVGLYRRHPSVGAVLLATVVGSLPLCLIAISKPRYAFGFEPILLIGAILVATSPRLLLSAITRRDRWVVAACAVFLVWGWTAWVIFAVTSRVALANAA